MIIHEEEAIICPEVKYTAIMEKKEECEKSQDKFEIKKICVLAHIQPVSKEK